MSTFSESFEQAVPLWLSACVEFADGLDGVSHVWVVHQDDGWASVTSTAFKVNGRVFAGRDLTYVLSHRTDDELGDFYNELLDSSSLFDELDPSEIPQRTVVRYDVVAESMDAEFTFDEIIPAECEIPDNRVMDLWIDRLKATGDDSAVMVMTPEQMKL